MVEGNSIAVSLVGSTVFTAKVVDINDSGKPVDPSPKKAEYESDGMVMWGADNQFPQNALKKIKASPGLSSGMNFLTSAFSSFKIRYGVLTGYKDDGTPIYDRTPIPEVEELLQRVNPTLYLMDFASEAFRLWNPYVSIYKTLNGKGIGRFVVERTKDCRVSTHNDRGHSEFVYINSNWENGAKVTDNTTRKRKLIDRYMNAAEVLAQTKDDVVTMDMVMPETGDDIYQQPPWYSFVESGWYDIAQAIPKLKKARLKNLAQPAWILYIPHDYFVMRYAGKWGKNIEEDKAIVKAEVADWQKCCLGTDNQGKMITNLYMVDQMGKEYGKWELKKVEMEDGGEYLDDSYESYSMLYRSLGFDGQLIGSIPAKGGQGNSGGSDKREGTNVLFTSLTPIGEVALQPFYVHRDFHKLNPLLRYWLEVPYMPSKNEITTKDRTPTNATN